MANEIAAQGFPPPQFIAVSNYAFFTVWYFFFAPISSSAEVDMFDHD